MSDELELELTFLAKGLPPEIESTSPTRIIDIYIPDTPGHSHLRLRQKGDKYEITKKTPVLDDDASRQIERTIPLTKDEFTALAGCSNKRVAKDRYKLNIDGKLAEIDVFLEDLTALVIIDFQLRDLQQKPNFIAQTKKQVHESKED